MAEAAEEEEFDLVLPPEEEEIEVIDDTPEEDRGRPVAAEDSQYEDDEADIESASERVKKRIAKLTADRHAEQRAKEQAARERDEAIRVAREAIAQAQNLKAQTNQYEQGFVYTAKSKAEIEIEQANAEYQKAFENGDSKAMADAMQKATRAQISKSQFDNYVPPPVQQQAPVQQQPPAPPPINREEVARQTQFIRDNPWFNKDQDMTERALQIDAHVRQTAPQIVGTDEYYDFIETMMKQSFPNDRFNKSGATAQRKPQAQGVAPVTRAGGKPARKTVTLTESQVRIAKKLGLTVQQYAAELIKENN